MIKIWKKVVVMFRTNLFEVFIVPVFCHAIDYLRLFLAYSFGQNFWWIYSLGKNLEQRRRIQIIFTKIMNRLVSTKNRIFIYLVGPNGSVKT